MSTANTPPDLDAIDPDDMFKDTRMSFGDHLEDLRAHLLRALLGFVIGMVISLYPLGQYVVRIIVSPLEQQLDKFEEKMLNNEIKKRDDKGLRPAPAIYVDIMISLSDLERAQRNNNAPNEEVNPAPPVLEKMTRGIERLLDELDLLPMLDKEIRREHGNFVMIRAKLPDPKQLTDETARADQRLRGGRVSTMNITEAFMVYFKVSMMTGFVISSPWIFFHIWAFVAAGLYPSEKKLVNVYLPFSLFLFLSGVLVCQFLVMPRAIEAMLWFNEWLGMAADLRLNEWLSFALMMPIVFGASFQTPLVMMFLHKIGLLSVQTFRERRRIAWFVMAVFAALITPSVDAFSMLFLWVPMGALYELGILLCVYQGEQDALAEWEQEEKSNELVEV